jgi:hypothetical protein
MLNLRFVGSGKVEIARGSGARNRREARGPSELATVTMMALTPRGDGK